MFPNCCDPFLFATTAASSLNSNPLKSGDKIRVEDEVEEELVEGGREKASSWGGGIPTPFSQVQILILLDLSKSDNVVS